jgi:uncharacterized membrane protein YsdA (DUF1294 family)/cold shock CspA family protein
MENLMQKQGRLKRWNDDKGFGFIVASDGGGDIFIHISAFNERGFRPKVNQKITFTTSIDKQGRERAEKARIVGHESNSRKVKSSQRPQKRNRPSTILIIGFSLSFLISLIVLVIIGKLSGVVLYWYLMLTVLALAFYKNDKEAAKRQYWRTSENTLQLLSLLGGWPGALIAQKTLHHKSSKTSFKVIFYITMIINLTGFSWFFTEQGQLMSGFLDSFLEDTITELFKFS